MKGQKNDNMLERHLIYFILAGPKSIGLQNCGALLTCYWKCVSAC